MKKIKCNICQQQDAYYGMQYIDKERNPTFTPLGDHYRGAKVVAKVCTKCKDKLYQGSLPITRD